MPGSNVYARLMLSEVMQNCGQDVPSPSGQGGQRVDRHVIEEQGFKHRMQTRGKSSPCEDVVLKIQDQD